ncbi:NAD(P)-dependent dehydrogenase (short-subunit alcohol dehydrogenase family) [Variovorax sp. TBS-050B]|uniref:SDR family NAD(P)-dependent oxidoreductase n=1 Tax=Variovorax sp. TBS-050B TaxID=2940551 RepID=UPI002473619E|nr:SDR family NAD(P)-dependent oxidoreductase [Variovorax sp. TBS-050B]MDH6590555.1 NAD(P)-dependent dehydrogenase (short-subunit alcohol dehydrogenase family) [Variovorax sp. TBS-050B]
MKKLLDGHVAIVTGAGSGLGRAHALALAQHGARVVVNDVAGSQPGSPGHAVVEDIVRAGGAAIADGGDVCDFAAMEAMAARAVEAWGRIDILVNNAGVLRDRSFSKMPLDDFRRVMEVHLMGSVHCTKAVWETMRAQRYGRIVMTTSSSGLYGNFGQSNYSAAKMALVGLMQTLALEGARQDIRVNCLAPTAATAMTEGVLPPEALARLQPAYVSPGLVALVAEDAPTRTILLAGAGSFESAHVTMTEGIFIDGSDEVAAQVAARMDEIRDRRGERVPGTGFEQYQLELAKAGFDVPLPH